MHKHNVCNFRLNNTRFPDVSNNYNLYDIKICQEVSVAVTPSGNDFQLPSDNCYMFGILDLEYLFALYSC